MANKLKMSPLYSLLKFIYNLILLRIKFIDTYNKQLVKMRDGMEFEVFRHIIVGKRKLPKEERGAIFIVRFKLSEMSVEQNIKFSRFPIPMFAGLTGFRAKFWFLNRNNGFNQGIYQWKTEQDAINYSNSFAVKFMMKRSVKDSISYEILPNRNIYDYIAELKIENNTQ